MKLNLPRVAMIVPIVLSTAVPAMAQGDDRGSDRYRGERYGGYDRDYRDGRREDRRRYSDRRKHGRSNDGRGYGYGSDRPYRGPDFYSGGFYGGGFYGRPDYDRCRFGGYYRPRYCYGYRY